jgi:hypothetical protein
MNVKGDSLQGERTNWERRGGKGYSGGKKIEAHYIWRQHNETHQALFQKRKEWDYNGGSELAQSTLYTSMELSQWNLLLLLMYANSKI